MGKKSVPDRIASPSPEPHGLLHNLIDALHQLTIMISSRLRHALTHGPAMKDRKVDVDIGRKLRKHIESISADNQANPKPRTKSKAPAARPNVKADTEATAQEFSAIAEHSKQKATSMLLPRMKGQLQSSTMEHINLSLVLARQGNSEGAKLHVELAESAMHAASRFMSHEEFEIFKQKVEHRMDSIVRKDSQDDAEA